jgi:hypothetical protein
VLLVLLLLLLCWPVWPVRGICLQAAVNSFLKLKAFLASWSFSDKRAASRLARE